MIIECQTCHARFRLDESRIKGRGARVKCRKCGDSIVVLKNDSPTAPAPAGDGFFDLGSAVRDSAGESPNSPPPVGKLISFPGPVRPEETGAMVPSSPFLEAEVPGRDEVDLRSDRVLSAGEETSSPPVRDAEIPAPAEADIPVKREDSSGQGPRPDLDFGALTLDLGPEEKLDLPPAEKLEPPLVEPPAVEESAAFQGEGGFLISDSDTLDILQEKHRDAGPESPPGSTTSPWRSRPRRSTRGVPFCGNPTRPRRLARIGLLRPRPGPPSWGTSHRRKRPPSKSRRTGKRSPPPRPPWSPRSAVDPRRRKSRAHDLPSDSRWR